MLTQKIREDMTAAMKAHNDLRVQTLRGAISAFTNDLVARGRKPTEELSDDEAAVVIRKLTKQRKDSIEQFTKGGRAELALKEANELKVLEEYLPQGASREEIEKIARAKMTELGITTLDGIGMAANTGKLVGAVVKELGPRGDGTQVKSIIAGMMMEKI